MRTPLVIAVLAIIYVLLSSCEKEDTPERYRRPDQIIINRMVIEVKPRKK